MNETEHDTGQARAKHDELFKKVFGERGNARDFLEAYLPPEVLAHLDMDTLRRIPASFVDEKLKKHYADLVFSVKSTSSDCPEIRFYLLFEHKAWPDEFVGIQVVRYMAMHWESILDDKSYKHPKLPPILPIVFYQNNDGWVPRTSFRELIYTPSEAFARYIPDFSFDFSSANNLDPKTVQHNVVLKFYVAILQALDSPELADLLPLLVQGLFESLEPREAMEYIIVFLTYLSKATQRLRQEDYEHALIMLPQGGRDIMNTLADQWIKQGRDEGWRDGRSEGWRDGMNEGEQKGELKAARTILLNQASSKFEYLPVGFSRKIHAIEDVAVLNALSISLLKAESLEALEAMVDKAAGPVLH